MDLSIHPSSGQPIYEQIYTQIKNLIIAGQLIENTPLPSMRLLAKELRISVITTKRAYEELERDGLIVSITGKGSFVAGGNLELIREENLRRIEEHLQSALSLADGCGLCLTDVVQMLTVLSEETP